MKKKKKKTFLSSLERFIYKLFAVIIILLIVGIVCSETSLAQMNLDIQKQEAEVEKQRKRIERVEFTRRVFLYFFKNLSDN